MNSKKPFTLESIATITNCRLVGNPSHVILGVADLETASSQDASFFPIHVINKLLKNQMRVLFLLTHK